MDLITLAFARKYTDKAVINSLSSAGIYRFKGSVVNFTDLPTDAQIGDVYNVENEHGQNYAWNGTEWDSLGGTLNADIRTDNVSIIQENGILALQGFATAPELTHPVKQSNGMIAWEPSPNANILALQSLIGEIPESSSAGTIIDYIDEQMATTIKGIVINGETIDPTSGIIEIPLATKTAYGLVKSSDEENSISVNDDGIMTINSLNVNKLSQTANEELILNCGDAN